MRLIELEGRGFILSNNNGTINRKVSIEEGVTIIRLLALVAGDANEGDFILYPHETDQLARFGFGNGTHELLGLKRTIRFCVHNSTLSVLGENVHV